MATRGRAFRDDDTLQQIINAADAVISFCRGMRLDQFQHDVKPWSATQYQILVIGEAVGRLSSTFILAHPEVPWNDIRDMRNILAHGYDMVRLDIVWQTATQDVPDLRALLMPLLPPQDSDSDEDDALDSRSR